MVNEKTWEYVTEIEQRCFDVWGVKGRLEIKRKSRDYAVLLYIRDECKFVMCGRNFHELVESLAAEMRGGKQWVSQTS